MGKKTAQQTLIGGSMRDISVIVAIIGLLLMAFARHHSKRYMGLLVLIVALALIIFYFGIG